MRTPLLHLLALSGALAQSGPWDATPHYFPRTNRRTAVLNGSWAFGWAPPGLDVLAATYADIATPSLTQVPSSFDVAPPGIKGPRTTVFYRSTHPCTPGSSALLSFAAVNFFARVFADGAELGNHTSPYTPFSFVAPACGARGTRELALIVNNVFNATLCPTCTGGDFYFFGGIIRPVIVTELPTAAPFYISRVEPLTQDVAAGLITVRVVLAGAPPPAVTLSLAFGGGAAAPQPPAPVVGGVATLRGVAVPNARPWALGQGNLFTLTVAEAASGDAVTTRSGLRLLSVAPGPPARLAINGAPAKLLGFNRHHMWPDTGAAVTPAQEAVDLALVKRLNANYIRGGH